MQIGEALNHQASRAPHLKDPRAGASARGFGLSSLEGILKSDVFIAANHPAKFI